MPLQRDQAHFLLLFLCVPLQYFVVQYTGSNESTRSFHISQIVKQAQDFYRDWFKLESWIKWLHKQILDLSNVDPGTGKRAYFIALPELVTGFVTLQESAWL